MKDNKELYTLKKDAVDKLVTASKETAPKVSDEEIAKISGRKRRTIPNIVKVYLIKFWFHGATCFFFYLGLGTYVSGFYDMMLVMMVATGIITDLLTNNMLRFVEPSEGYNEKYMMVRSRKYQSFVLNLLYGVVIVYIIYYLYNLINLGLLRFRGDKATLLAVEPLLYGLFGVIIDQLLVGARNLLTRIVEDAKKSALSKT